MDREATQLFKKGFADLKRLADAVEKLNEPQDVELDIPPPQCPHCRTINPQILIQESEAKGPMIEFVLQATCLHCKSTFYSITPSWMTFVDRQEAIVNANVIKERIIGNASE